mgnify:CR=1 FL=1
MSLVCLFFFQAEDGIRDLVRSRGLGDVYKRQPLDSAARARIRRGIGKRWRLVSARSQERNAARCSCLLYTSDAADERSSVDLGGRRIIKKKKKRNTRSTQTNKKHNTASADERLNKQRSDEQS